MIFIAHSPLPPPAYPPALEQVVLKNENTVPSFIQPSITKPLNLSPAIRMNNNLVLLFDTARQTKNFKPFVGYIGQALPPLAKSTSTTPPLLRLFSTLRSNIMGLNTLETTHPYPIKVALNPRGMIQIYVNQEPLMITPEKLAERSETKDNDVIVGGGIRGLDPTYQPDWKKTDLKREWPPSPQQTVEILKDVTRNTLAFTTPFNSDYKVQTAGMVSLIPDESSIVWAYEQSNQNPDLAWGAWTIAPLDVPANKRVINAYNASPQFSEKYAADLKINQQWQYDEKRNVVFVYPEKEGGFLDPFNDETKWTVHAVEGRPYAVVLRTIYKTPFQDKAKSCMVEGKATYVENEFMGPKVSNGQKSIVVCRMDLVPLQEITHIKGDAFDAPNMTEQVFQVVDYLKAKTQ